MRGYASQVAAAYCASAFTSKGFHGLTELAWRQAWRFAAAVFQARLSRIMRAGGACEGNNFASLAGVAAAATLYFPRLQLSALHFILL